MKHITKCSRAAVEVMLDKIVVTCLMLSVMKQR